VKDYDAWRKAFDGLAELRTKGGASEVVVMRAKNRPNLILVTSKFATVEEAQALNQNPERAEAMKGAGVIPPVRVEFYEEA
jgi:hypothetical protein